MKYLLILIMWVFPLVAFGAIEGKYDISGWDPYEQEKYSGTAIISKGKNNVYKITWNFSDGHVYKGTGIMGANGISFVFYDADPDAPEPRICGLQIFSGQEDTLSGNWLLYDKNLIGNETLKKKL